MLFDERKIGIIVVTLFLLFTVPVFVSAQDEVVDLRFGQPPVSQSDRSRTLQSPVKVQGTGGPCQHGLYLLTLYGDREDIYQEENQALIDNPLINQSWRYCSVFSTAAENSVIMGRNWDNENVGSIIVSLCHPPNGYSSISFCRAIDLGIPLHMDLEQLKLSEIGNKLLLAPFYATDGVNEHGVAVAVAGVRQTTHRPKSDKQTVFVTFLIRKILDQTRNIEEAVDLVENFIPFQLDKNTLSAHFIVADSSGRSVILEYDQDQWRKTYGDKPWQVLTTKPIYSVPDEKLRESCWRYRIISEALEKKRGNVDLKNTMGILRDVAQKGTTWSVAYALRTKELYFSVYQSWDVIYHLTMP
ncbi:MAG: hypothetical protein AMJ46_09865 [Latescibacteria bacterium DG_63]|nr:MAG: hypothetical protein AMJ46_09865 [Latescibacteria bacterium DG_63]